MAFFFPNYNKPGKGVDESAPPKRRFFLFFELFFRKFTRLIMLNMLYLIAIIPTFLILFAASGIVLSIFLGEMPPFELSILLSLLITCLWGAGPVTAGLVYIVRNFSCEEHSWVFSDFWEHTRKNFKQAIIVFAIDLVALYMFFVAFSFYFFNADAPMFLAYVIILVFAIYTLMHLYIYPIMVTFKLPLCATKMRLYSRWLGCFRIF